MKKSIYIICLTVLVAGMFGCRKYLDINSDPASPSVPSLPALLSPAQAVMSRTLIFDARGSGAYTQFWSNVAVQETFDIHNANQGGASTGAAGLGAQGWRDVYQLQGPSINLIIQQGIQNEQWDYVGVAFALRAWGFQYLTDMYSDIVFRQAWEPNRVFFDYDDQETVYRGIDSICRQALRYLARTDGKVNQSVLARGDQIYQGNRDRWIKFVYGLMARNYQRLSNKAEYKPDSVIRYVDLSFTNNNENAFVPHAGTRNDDTNPMGPARDNFSVRRQSRFIVQLLDGTILRGSAAPANRDPRIRGMLSISPDTSFISPTMTELNGGYRFLTPAVGYTLGTAGSLTFRRGPATVWGDSAIANPAIGNFADRTIGKYLFRNNAPLPVMTYHELQFIKAEAALLKGDKATAFAAYRNGITAHFDFVNAMNTGTNNFNPISNAERTAYLSSAAVKQNAVSLTLTDIMQQKFIANWGWNFLEQWCDMRRYHYYDVDPETNLPVFNGFHVITVFSAFNGGPNMAYRFWPTNFSEFDWNREALRKIGALNQNYHTLEMWFSQP
jgi:hypothetical protein